MTFSKIFTVAVMSLGLAACAINVTPSAFFHQDNHTKPLTTTKLHAAIEQDQTSAGITRVEIDNGQGLTLRGVAVSYADPVVNIVFYADNRMPVSENNSVLHRLGKIPANILWMDYQGVGASEKSEKLSINAIKADALTVFDYAEGIFDKSLPTIVHGRGVGSYFASYVAANKPIGGLVLDGAFNDISDLIANMVPGFSNSLTSMKLHPEVHLMQIAPILRHYEGPLWLLVGEKDVITPFEISKQLLATAASDAKYISVVPGATHNATLKHDFAIEEYQRFISHISP
ncbi:alpha/beta hydrolase [Alteromonas lipotrueae]|uniref:alpha/beta hydrolase n=1 Tax=Alteromonas lipotrueae TaxID=2803814 RepID=UPI001C46A7C4|nr:alpha/beta hydrolase [Alteromonas lipotrueae]